MACVGGSVCVAWLVGCARDGCAVGCVSVMWWSGVVGGVRLVFVQVPLMGVVSSAVAAMDAHRGVSAVAEHGVCFLRNLAVVDGTEVRCGGVWGLWRHRWLATHVTGARWAACGRRVKRCMGRGVRCVVCCVLCVVWCVVGVWLLCRCR